MGKNKKSAGDAGEKGAKGAIQYTTFRVYSEDGEDLADLAQMDGTTIAEVYRRLCAPLVREAHIKRAEEKLKALKENRRK